ncbi:peptide deformylase [Paracoccus laeviglucosivorans]|uniref:Peptide deformylase n=1 Tax=Paracoccus laeviglucosivorans TaxID=1197861 RepID=A0A521AU16_9RHOB|nr:peptide deformylase [Paracoccus laeviglucosivorans]SMO38348.1 peptide deformylase [Paracoccus laeviglucosivorans]
MPEPLTGNDIAKAPEGPGPAELAGRGRIRPILIHPDPVLRQICTPVGHLSWDRLCQLAGDLLATMYDAKGRGLAAPQIGEPFRMFVMDAHWKSGEPQPRIFLDPTLLAFSGSAVLEEGCLSIPDHPVTVARPTEITFGHFDMMGNARSTTLSGIEARIALHEADHLDGRLIIDYLPDAGRP